MFPAFPAYGRAITLRHLLTHTSGLPDYEDLMAEAEKGRAPIWTAEHQIHDDEVLALLRGEARGRFAPGTSWAYSNSGYVVLGLVVARVSGKPFGEFLRQRVFAPLEMRHTVAYEQGRSEVERRAYGHARDGAGFRQEDQSATSATLGDGGVYSTLEDLAKWDEALQTYELALPGCDAPRPDRGEARGRLRASLARRGGRRQPRPGEARCPTASAGSSTPGEATPARGTTARPRASGRSSSASPTIASRS